MYPCTVLNLCVFFGILGYSVHGNGGSVGSLVTSTVHLSSSQRAFRMVQCVSSIGGTWAATSERISDWTRFSRSRNAPNLAFFVAIPLGVTFSLCLVLSSPVQPSISSAKFNGTLLCCFRLGKHKIIRLPVVQVPSSPDWHSSSVRSMSIWPITRSEQVWTSQDSYPNIYLWEEQRFSWLLVQSLFNRGDSFHRLTYSFTYSPSRLVSSVAMSSRTELIITLLVLFPGSTAIVLCDYYIIRTRKWQIPDLFVGNPDGIYW